MSVISPCNSQSSNDSPCITMALRKMIHGSMICYPAQRTFDSYKLRIHPKLHFAGDDLQSIRLHRAECLESLQIYAPNLKDLNLQACYDLMGDLIILDDHPNFINRIRGKSRFTVNTTNACISQSVTQAQKLSVCPSFPVPKIKPRKTCQNFLYFQSPPTREKVWNWNWPGCPF